MDEEQLRKATVGELKRFDSRILLADYDPGWPDLFEREAARIRSVLGNRVVQLEHVGSTSVPGLPAKPIIDIMLVVPNSGDEAAYVGPLEAAGYRLRLREPDWHEHRLLKGPATSLNLHVFSADSSEIDRMLLFRDWLRTHDHDRRLYEQAKRELSTRTWKYVQNYADAKTEVVERIIARAQSGKPGGSA